MRPLAIAILCHRSSSPSQRDFKKTAFHSLPQGVQVESPSILAGASEGSGGGDRRWIEPC
ncbi:hypothetical protein [Laspinema olomoucense]|uniref:Uncharacterized protein n=1 Tax=Laspinema olomoucense D3b TaxID=2953688 RepID=A0ABT2NCY4_9CYAN|nr:MULTISPECIES: hypothetical protein [unclassified Laspinema]MCT7980561.1 hypothetical protein [Laspinema sp. D3b]MCT7992627.1 hypothetical protein [Laspinema sp. D3c]